MRNILLLLLNNFSRIKKDNFMKLIIIIGVPLILFLGIYFSGDVSGIKGKVAVVGASITQQEDIIRSMEKEEKVSLKFLNEEISKVELIKGKYLAEIKYTGDNLEIISYRDDEMKKNIQANLEGKPYEAQRETTTRQGKIIGLLTIFLFMIAKLLMGSFLEERENGVFVRILTEQVSYYEYIIAELIYTICILTIPTLIISLIFFGVFPIELNISIVSFSLFIVLISLIGSSIAILISNIFKNKNSVEFVSSMIILITSIWGGGIVNVEDSNKIIGFIRDCLPQKRLIDLANSYNNEDLIFLIIMMVVFISISLIIGERKYRNGEFI